MLIKRIAGSILFALCCPITVSAAEDFVVIVARVSPTMQRKVPNSADDVFRECSEDAQMPSSGCSMGEVSDGGAGESVGSNTYHSEGTNDRRGWTL